MRQVLQHLRSGEIQVADVPSPAIRPGHLLIQTTRSLISSGTERSLVEFSQASLLGKARAQPEKVRQVLQKIKTDGLMPTLEVVFQRLDEPLPLGYCNAGKVVGIGAGVRGYHVGDRVVSNGAHAEMVCVPTTLAAHIPDGVSDEAASFTVLGAIGLHGIRLAAPTMGEKFAVIGLGLVGLLTMQLLRRHGCQVIGIDPNPQRCQLAQQWGFQAFSAEDGHHAVASATSFSGGQGVDGVLITASAKTNDIIHQAAGMCRKRGRIVLVGVVGLDLQRSDFYAKELTFQVSCSYGPGRYDDEYEAKVRDYPLPYVRWTAARNFAAVLESLADGAVEIEPLISSRIAHSEASNAYERIVNDPSSLGVMLTYPAQAAPDDKSVRLTPITSVASSPTKPIIGVIGAGQFTKLVLLPSIKAAGGHIEAIASSGGVSAAHAGRSVDAAIATSDVDELLDNTSINTVFIATRHNTHADLVCRALSAGKHVFVEKPLAIDESQLQAVRQACQANPNQQLMVGFNRRFAPHTQRVTSLLASRVSAINVIITVNAGAIPPDSWHHDPEIGGGRIIGEGCHFIDLLVHLIDQPITSVHALAMQGIGNDLTEDTVNIQLRFVDGSIGTIHYFSNGPKSYPKERVEVFSEGRGLVIDNWRSLRGFNWSGVTKMRMRQDKGHRAEVTAFLHSVQQGGAAPIPLSQIDMVTAASFAVNESLRTRQPITLAYDEQEPAQDNPPITPAANTDKNLAPLNHPSAPA